MERIVQTVREDGAWIDSGENDNLMVNKLIANPNAVGVFGYSFLEQNADKLKGANVDNPLRLSITLPRVSITFLDHSIFM